MKNEKVAELLGPQVRKTVKKLHEMIGKREKDIREASLRKSAVMEWVNE